MVMEQTMKQNKAIPYIANGWIQNWFQNIIIWTLYTWKVMYLSVCINALYSRKNKRKKTEEWMEIKCEDVDWFIWLRTGTSGGLFWTR